VLEQVEQKERAAGITVLMVETQHFHMVVLIMLQAAEKEVLVVNVFHLAKMVRAVYQIVTVVQTVLQRTEIMEQQWTSSA